MVRYPIPTNRLRENIRARSPEWFNRATDRTRWLKEQGRFVREKGDGPVIPDWGDIKQVYRDLQGNKCAYCERPLTAEIEHSREHDVEHFRPKGDCSEWNPTSLVPPPRKGPDTGYYWLAYDPLNYCTSCKTCNQDLKKTKFPIDGNEGRVPNRIKTLNKNENPILIYPIGEIDVNPEDHITFIGNLPKAVEIDGQKSRRGEGTIVFFRLHDRKELIDGRAFQIVSAHDNLELAANGDVEACAYVKSLIDAKRQFSGAVRAYVRLWYADRDSARDMARDLKRYVASLR